MRFILLIILILPSLANAQDWGDRRLELLNHRLPLSPAIEGRAKPDESGIYDIIEVQSYVTITQVIEPRMRHQIRLLIQSPVDGQLPFAAISFAPLNIAIDGIEVDFDYRQDSFELFIDPGRPLEPGEIIIDIETQMFPCQNPLDCVLDGPYLSLTRLGWFPISFEFPLGDRFIHTSHVTFNAETHHVSASGALIHEGPGLKVFQTPRSTALPIIVASSVTQPPLIADGIETYTPRHVDRSVKLMESAHNAISVYRRILGAFPVDRIALFPISDEVPAAIGPMNHALLPEIMWHLAENQNDIEGHTLARRVLTHELGHQYFYNLIGVIDQGEAWLSEAFAEYCAIRASRSVGDEVHAAQNYWHYLLGIPPERDAPITDPFLEPDVYQILVYFKGSSVVDMLVQLIQRETGIEEPLLPYVEAFAEQIATTTELQAFFEGLIGRSLDQFFQQWVYGTGYPTLRITAEPARDLNAPIRLTIEQDGDFAGPLPLAIRLSDGRERVEVVELSQGDYRLPGNNAQSLRVDPTRSIFRRIVIDPPADVDLSGVVDGKDLLDILYAQGAAAGADVRFTDQLDINDNGQITNRDVRAIVESFGAGW